MSRQTVASARLLERALLPVLCTYCKAGSEAIQKPHFSCWCVVSGVCLSQAASFPAPDHDGPFSEWSELSQRDQRGMLGVLLGEAFFDNHPDPRVCTR